MLEQTINFKITQTHASRVAQVDWENLPFGRIFSDHMLVMEYSDGEWKTPEILPFGPIPVHPATSALHYGQAIFEGMKANRSTEGDVLIFRPEMNARRFQESCERMGMPIVPEALFVECVRKLVDLDREWIPNKFIQIYDFCFTCRCLLFRTCKCFN